VPQPPIRQAAGRQVTGRLATRRGTGAVRPCPARRPLLPRATRPARRGAV